MYPLAMVLFSWALVSVSAWLSSFRPEFAAYRRPAEISLIVEGAVVGVPVALAVAARLADYIGERRDLARARRCWDRFCRGAGPWAFAREGEEILVVAMPGVLQVLRDVSDLRRRTAYTAYCCRSWDPGSLPRDWEWAAWPYRYRDRVRVWAFAAPDFEEAEARLAAAGFRKLPPHEFWDLVEDWRAFLSQGRRVAEEKTGTAA